MKRPSPALVLSCLALFLGFTGGAVAAVQISGKQIKDGSITGKDIKNDTVTPADIKGSVQGPAGPRGATGPAGPPGSSVQASPASGAVSYHEVAGDVPGGGLRTVSASCPAGQVPTGGGYLGAAPQLSIVSSYPDDTDLDGTPDSWSVTADNGEMGELPLRVDVTCITPTTVTGFPPA